MNQRQLEQAALPFESVIIHANSHASYYPGAAQLALKLLFSPQDGRIYGAQAVGPDGVEKRIDVIATAIKGNLSVYDLEELELCYAPPFGSSRTGLNLEGINLNGARLDEADFEASILRKANFAGASLVRANLSNTDLSEAILINADLTRARLTNIKATRADFSGANLTGADIRKVRRG